MSASSTPDDAGSETAVKGFPEKEKISSNINFDVDQRTGDPVVVIAKGTHEVEDKDLKVERTFRLTEDLEELIQDTKEKRGGEVVESYTAKVSTDDVDDVKKLCDKMHHADPQVEFESFKEYGGDQ